MRYTIRRGGTWSKVGITVATAALACILSGSAYASTITQGFETGVPPFSFSAGIGDTAALATSPVYAGNYSANISVASGMDDAEVDIDLSSDNLTLGDLTSANYWVYLASGSNSNAPYIYFPVVTPGGTAYVVMFNPHDMGIDLSSSVWTNIQINPNTTAFHVAGVDTGITNPGGLTLAQLTATEYSPGVTWGSFTIDAADIEVGQEGDSLASDYYIDNLTINTVPEPPSIALLAAGLLGLGFAMRRRFRKTARIAA